MDIEPINPEAPGPLVMEALNFKDDPSPVYWAAAIADENSVVTMKWTNATLTIRGGTLQAWIDLGIITAA